MGAALGLKGSLVGGEVFAFDALRCDNSHALPRHLGRRFCGGRRSQANQGMPVKVPAGELSILQLERGTHFQAILCKKKRSTEPLDIREPTRLSITECGEVSTPGAPTREDERQI